MSHRDLLSQHNPDRIDRRLLANNPKYNMIVVVDQWNYVVREV